MRRLAVSIWLVVAAAGCGEVQCDCLECRPAITLDVVATDGNVPTGVEVVGAGGFTCAPTGLSVVCTSDVARSGSHPLIVRADGWDDVALTVAVEVLDDCCGCGYRAIDRSIVLGDARDAGM